MGKTRLKSRRPKKHKSHKRKSKVRKTFRKKCMKKCRKTCKQRGGSWVSWGKTKKTYFDILNEANNNAGHKAIETILKNSGYWKTDDIELNTKNFLRDKCNSNNPLNLCKDAGVTKRIRDEDNKSGYVSSNNDDQPTVVDS